MKDCFGDDFEAIFAEFARRVRPGRFEPNTDVALSDDGESVIVTPGKWRFPRSRPTAARSTRR